MTVLPPHNIKCYFFIIFLKYMKGKHCIRTHKANHFKPALRLTMMRSFIYLFWYYWGKRSRNTDGHNLHYLLKITKKGIFLYTYFGDMFNEASSIILAMLTSYGTSDMTGREVCKGQAFKLILYLHKIIFQQ